MNAEQYRRQAAQLRAKARGEESRSVRDELESLAQCYLLLAEQSDRKSWSEGGSMSAAPVLSSTQ